MVEQNELKLFEGKQIRYVWDDEREQYFFSVVDVIEVLTESNTPRRYWSDLKRKLAAEGSELYEKIVQLKLPSSDGKSYMTDVATTEQLLRLIQSVPSKRAEPFKLWLAEVGRKRLEQLQDPEQSIEQEIKDYVEYATGHRAPEAIKRDVLFYTFVVKCSRLDIAIKQQNVDESERLVRSLDSLYAVSPLVRMRDKDFYASKSDYFRSDGESGKREPPHHSRHCYRTS